MGARCLSTCHAVRAPDFSICSAVIVNVPGGTPLLVPRWTAGPHPSHRTTNDAVSAFMEASRFNPILTTPATSVKVSRAFGPMYGRRERACDDPGVLTDDDPVTVPASRLACGRS